MECFECFGTGTTLPFLIPLLSPDFSGSSARILRVRFVICSPMDEETASAFAVEEFEKVLSEFSMQDFTPKAGQSQETEVPETSILTSPEKTSPDLTVVDDYIPVCAALTDATEETLKKETISDLAAESVSVSTLEVDSVAPSLTSVPDPHSAPDSALTEASETHTALETKGAHAGESLSGSAVQSTSMSDSDGTYMIPDADWVTGRGRIGSYCLDTVQLS